MNETANSASASTRRRKLLFASGAAAVLIAATALSFALLGSSTPKASPKTPSYKQGFAEGVVQAKVPANVAMFARGLISAKSVCQYTYTNTHVTAVKTEWVSGCIDGFGSIVA